MKRFRLIFSLVCIALGAGPSLTAFAEDCGANPEFQEAVSALICKRDQCPDLNQPNTQGNIPDDIYLAYCSNYGIDIRNRIAGGTIANVIFELQRTRFPSPPTLIPPCECLAMAFSNCDVVEQCKDQVPKPAGQPAPIPNPIPNPTTGTTKAEVPEPAPSAGSCQLQAATSTPCWGIPALGLGLFLFLGIGRHLKFGKSSAI